MNYLGFRSIFNGRWDQALDALSHAAVTYQRIGNDRDREVALNACGVVYQMTGFLDKKREISIETMASAERRGDRQMLLWTPLLLAETGLRLGGAGHEQEIFDLVRIARAENPDPFEEINIHGLLAQAHYRLGELEDARKAVETAVDQYKTQRPILNFYYIDSYASLSQASLSLWETVVQGNSDFAPQEELKELAVGALKLFSSFARIYSFARSRAALYQGTFDWLSGKQSRAKKGWAKSLALAEELGMPYDQGLAHYEIGRHLPADDLDRKQHLQQAAAHFTQLDTTWDLTLVKEALIG